MPGTADYFNVDVVLVRIIALFALFCFSAGFWVYLVLWIAVPLEPASANGGDNYGKELNMEPINVDNAKRRCAKASWSTASC